MLVTYDRGKVKKYFLFVANYLTWKAASDWCLNQGATLACIRNREENAFITNLFTKIRPGTFGVWLGGTDVDQEGQWRWEDRSRFTDVAWASGQPNNYDGQQHFLNLYKDGRWYDESERRRNYFIAQWVVEE